MARFKSLWQGLLCAGVKSRLAPLAGLILLAALPRVLMINNTVAPARDAFRFWEASYQLENEPFPQVLRSLKVQPIYPATLIALQWLTAPADPYDWLIANQCWSAVCYLGFLAVAFLVGSLLWKPQLAFFGCLAIGLLPRQIAYSCDVLSDSLFALLWMSSFSLLVLSVRELRCEGMNRKRLLRGCVGLAASGTLSGLAYLTRAEGLLVPVIVLGTLVLVPVMSGQLDRWKSYAGVAASFLVPFGVLAGGYMMLTGQVSPRNSAQAILGGVTVAEHHHVDIPEVFRDAKDSGSKVGEGTQPARPTLAGSLGVLLFEAAQETRGWLLVFAAIGSLHSLTRRQPIVEFLPALLAMAGCSILLVMLHYKAGYLASRYLTPVLPFLGIQAMVGVSVLWNFVIVDLRFPWERSWSLEDLRLRRRLVCALVLAALALGLTLPRWFQPLHPHRYPHMQAATWLAERSKATDLVFDPLVLTAYFSVRHRWLPTASLPEVFPFRFAVIDPNVIHWCDVPTRQAMERIVTEGKLVATFPRAPANDEAGVFLYEVKPLLAQQVNKREL